MAVIVQDGKNDTSNRMLVNSDGSINTIAMSALIPQDSYDYLSLSYDSDDNLTSVVFKSGGSSGTTVATLTLAYDSGGNLTDVTRT